MRKPYFILLLVLYNFSFGQSITTSIDKANFYLSQAKYDSARYYYKQADLKNKTPIVQYKLAETYRYVVEPESKIARTILLRLVSVKNIDSLLLAQSYNLLGIHYRYNEQPDSAKVCLEKAMYLGKGQNYFRPYAELTHYYINRGDLTVASKYAFEGLSLAEKYKDEEAKPYIYFQLASLHEELGKTDKMFLYANKALAIEEAKPYSKLLGDVYEILGLYYANSDRKQKNEEFAKKAIQYFELSYKAFEKVGQIRGMGYELIHLAMRKANLGNVATAKKHFSDAEKLFLQLYRPQSMAAFYLSYGDFLFSYNISKQSGMDYIHKAAAIWKENDRKTNLAVAYEALSIGYKLLGDYKQSLAYTQKYYQLNETIVDEKTQKQLQELNVKYETEKKDAQLALQKVELLKKQQRITQIALISSLVLLTFIILFALYRRWQLRKIAKMESSFEQTTQQLQSFNYSVSHDLRNPLINAQNSLNALQKEVQPNLAQLSLVEKTKAAISSMNEIIDAMLMLSSIEKGDLQLKEIDTQLLIEDIWDELSPNTELIVHKLPSIKADIRLLRQVFVNLLSNAVKYSSKVSNPQIEVSAISEKNKFVFHIRDNGVGFDERFSSKLFQLFGRLHANFDGIGVGLVIVKKIIEKHNGQVWAIGKPNEGATFSFELPA